jgi:tetratricopeptide (TPR) repeat protein
MQFGAHSIVTRFALAAILGVLIASAGGCDTKSVDDYLRAGDEALKANNLGDAEKNYLEAAKLAPEDPRAHLALGNYYVAQQNSESAQIEFMAALEFDPSSAPAHAALGEVYASQERLGLAEEQLRAAVALAPARADYRLKLGDVLRRQGKLAEAEAELRTAAGLAPKDARAPFALAGVISSDQDRQSEADGQYARAKALDPSLEIPTPPEPAEDVVAAAAPASKPKVRTLNKLFLLTKNSPVYENPSNKSKVVAQVKSKKYVHVIGITGEWFQIKLRNGTIGFIPVSTAE